MVAKVGQPVYLKRILFFSIFWVSTHAGAAHSTPHNTLKGVSDLEKFEPIQSPLPTTSLVVDFELRTDDPTINTQGCGLVFKEVEKNTEYWLPVTAKRARTVTQVTPGKYALTKFSCPIVWQQENYPTWDMSRCMSTPFVIAEGKISYIGFLQFEKPRGADEVRTGWQTIAPDGVQTLANLAEKDRTRVEMPISNCATTPKVQTVSRYKNN